MQQQKFSLVFSNWFYRVTTVQQRLFALVLIIGAVCGLTAEKSPHILVEKVERKKIN